MPSDTMETGSATNIYGFWVFLIAFYQLVWLYLSTEQLAINMYFYINCCGLSICLLNHLPVPKNTNTLFKISLHLVQGNTSFHACLPLIPVICVFIFYFGNVSIWGLEKKRGSGTGNRAVWEQGYRALQMSLLDRRSWDDCPGVAIDLPGCPCLTFVQPDQTVDQIRLMSMSGLDLYDIMRCKGTLHSFNTKCQC